MIKIFTILALWLSLSGDVIGYTIPSTLYNNRVLKNRNMNTEEQWRDVKGYEGIYQVSDLGRVRSLDRYVTMMFGSVEKDRLFKGGIKSLNNNGSGYLSVHLNKDGKGRRRYIHQLVAVAFLNHIDKGYKVVVDHRDNDKSNNKLSNLQVVTQRYNCSKDKKGYTSKYVGVHKCARGGKWRAGIVISGKKKRLGTYTDEIEAHKAYQKELNKLNQGGIGGEYFK